MGGHDPVSNEGPILSDSGKLVSTSYDAPSELSTIKEWYRYNTYVRKKYLKLLQTLSATELSRDRGASFPSLLDISYHILWAYRLWLDQMYSGVPLDEIDTFGRACNSIEELETEEARTDPHILDFVEKLTPEDILRWIERPRGNEVVKFNVRNMLWHLVEEELQHRGELNALLWQMNIDPPITGWGTWKRETEASA
jgi:uncharacterized damage-inducible protein DinB